MGKPRQGVPEVHLGSQQQWWDGGLWTLAIKCHISNQGEAFVTGAGRSVSFQAAEYHLLFLGGEWDSRSCRWGQMGSWPSLERERGGRRR